MYQRFFGLKQEPFSIAPDPRFLFMSERHREALAHLRYGLGSGGGFVLLTGEIGAGKTTICRCILEQVPDQCNLAYLFNPELTVGELLATVCAEFGIGLVQDDAQPESTKRSVDALNRFLLAAHAAGRHSVLIIDEAQRLSLALLEQLRLLTNLETNERKLLQIVLIGQPELRQMLARPELEQLSQRVVARFHLGTLSPDETASYVRHRLAVAGMEGAIPFDGAALRRIHRLSNGVPRRINLLCDRALLGAYSQGQLRVSPTIVNQAALEVFGVERGHGPSDRWLGWQNLAAMGVLVAVGMLAVSALNRAGDHPGPQQSPAATGAAATGAVATGAASTGAASTGAAAPSLAVAAGTMPPINLAPTPAPSTQASAPAAPMLSQTEFSALMLSSADRDEGQAWRALASGWRALPPGAEPCTALRAQGVQCFKRRGGMALLRGLDRPAILPLYLQDSTGPAARFAVLLGLTEHAATLRVGEREVRVSLPSLAMGWREEFGVLWQAPPGTRFNPNGSLLAVDAGWLAAQLAQSRAAPAQSVGTAAAAEAPPDAGQLTEHIRAFQRAHGLEVDGQVGAMTIMQLQRAGSGAEAGSGARSGAGVGGDNVPRLRH